MGFKCQGTTKFSETGQKIAFDCQIIPYHRKPFSSVMFFGGQDGSMELEESIVLVLVLTRRTTFFTRSDYVLVL